MSIVVRCSLLLFIIDVLLVTMPRILICEMKAFVLGGYML